MHILMVKKPAKRTQRADPGRVTGDFVRAERERRGVTRAEVARSSGLSRQTIYNFEVLGSFTADTLYRVATVLHLDELPLGNVVIKTNRSETDARDARARGALKALRAALAIATDLLGDETADGMKMANTFIDAIPPDLLPKAAERLQLRMQSRDTDLLDEPVGRHVSSAASPKRKRGRPS